MSLKYHPDKAGEDKERAYAAVQRAYMQLGHGRRRVRHPIVVSPVARLRGTACASSRCGRRRRARPDGPYSSARTTDGSVVCVDSDDPMELVVRVSPVCEPLRIADHDIHLRVVVSLDVALTGAWIRFTHPDHRTRVYRTRRGQVIPPGSFAIARGDGMADATGAAGDLYIHFEVGFPKDRQHAPCVVDIASQRLGDSDVVAPTHSYATVVDVRQGPTRHLRGQHRRLPPADNVRSSDAGGNIRRVSRVFMYTRRAMRPILSIHALSRAIRARSPDSVTAGDARALLRAYVGDDWWDWEQACRRHVVPDHTRPQPLVVAHPQWYRLRILHWAQGTSLPWHDHPGMRTVGMRVLRGHLEEDVLLRGDTTVRRYIRRPERLHLDPRRGGQARGEGEGTHDEPPPDVAGVTS